MVGDGYSTLPCLLMSPPREIRKVGDAVRAINLIIDYLRKTRIVASPDVKPQERVEGTALLITDGRGRGGGSGENVWQ